MSFKITILCEGALTEWAGMSGCSDPTGLAVPAQPTSVGKGSPAVWTCVRHCVCGEMVTIVREPSLFILFSG